MNNRTLGEFLAELRKEKGITQRELAEFLNVSDKTVSHWECDENSPDLSIIPIIAEFFGVTCDELIKGERTERCVSSLPSDSSHNYESFIRRHNEEKIAKAYSKHKILCITAVFVSFFSLMLLIGIIILFDDITNFDYTVEVFLVSVVFSIALCLLISFISKQNFTAVANSYETDADKNKKLKRNALLHCLFPLLYSAAIIFILVMIIMPSGSAGTTEPPTITIPTSIEPDFSENYPDDTDVSVLFSESENPA